MWLGTANWQGGFRQAPPRPQRGTSPRTTFSRSAIDRRSTTRQDSPVEGRYRVDWCGMLVRHIPVGARKRLMRFRTNRSCRLGAGTPRYEEPDLWLGYSELAQWILPGPTPTPAGDKPPHYISPSPPLWIPAFAGMTMRKIDGIRRHNRSGVGESRIGVRECFRTNRGWVAHQGMKNRSCRVQRIPVDRQAPPRPQRGTSPRTTFLPTPLDSSLRWNDEISWKAIPDRSPGSVFIGMTFKPRWVELWLGTANWHGGFCQAPPRPQRGTSPSPRVVFDRSTFSHSAIDHRSTARQVWPVESRHRG